MDNVTGACEKCAPGTYAASPSSYLDAKAEVCLDCPIDTFGPTEGANSCEPCPMHALAPLEGQVECVAVKGWYKLPSGLLKQCDAGMTTRGIAATTLAQCICDRDRLYNSESGGCAACPEGLVCQGDNRSLGDGFSHLRSSTGYSFRLDERGDLEVFKCRSDENCPGGPLGDTCQRGHSEGSIACASCNSGYFFTNRACQECTSTRGLLFICAMLLTIIVLTVVVWTVNKDIVLMRRSNLLFMTTVGEFVAFLQYSSVFAEMSVSWGEPLDDVWKLSQRMSLFDIESLGMACSAKELRDPALMFVIRHLCLPLLCLCIFALVCVKMFVSRRRWRLSRLFIDTLNMVGFILKAIYINMLTLQITAFHCYKHPSGVLDSVARYPSVLCWASSQHTIMMVVSCIFLFGTLCPGLALCLWATIYYKKAVLLQDDRFMRVFRFLFMRLRPKRYFWGICELMRNTLICFVPVLVPESAGTQLLLLVSLFACGATVEALVRPWRLNIANRLSAGICGSMVPLLMCGAIYSNVRPEGHAIYYSIFTLGTILVLLLLAIFVHSIRQMLKPPLVFSHFITHHKDAAAGQARVLHMLLQLVVGEKCFIDSDHLQDLDTLYDIVRSSVTNLVVYLTCSTLMRPWCIGEIATAVENRKNLVVVRCSDFVELDRDALEDLAMHIAGGTRCLTEYGISMSLAAASIRKVQEVSHIRLNPKPRPVQFREVAASVIERSSKWKALSGGKGPLSLIMGANSGGTPSETISNQLTSRGPLICSAVEDPEATASAYILSTLLAHSRFHSYDALIMVDMPPGTTDSHRQHLVQQASHVLLLLSERVLVSLQCMLAVCDARACGVHLVPVVLPRFQFPAETFYSEEYLPQLRFNEGLLQRRRLRYEDAVEVWRTVFRRVGVHLNTHGSYRALVGNVEEIAVRLKRPPAPVMTDAPTFGGSQSAQTLPAGEISGTLSTTITERSRGYLAPKFSL